MVRATGGDLVITLGNLGACLIRAVELAGGSVKMSTYLPDRQTDRPTSVHVLDSMFSLALLQFSEKTRAETVFTTRERFCRLLAPLVSVI